MFDTLTKGFRQARNRLAGLTELTESNVDAALREVRVSLIEADVELGVVKAFLARVKAKAIGQTLQSRVKAQGETHQVGASELFIKICSDELEEMMDHEGEPVTFAASGVTGIMMVGLQGAGKTTTCAKLARWASKEGKKPLLVAADMQRPAAVDQLKVLGAQLKLPVFNVPGASPVEICAQAKDEAKRLGCDVVVYDTAGRLAIDEPLMQELADIKERTKPDDIFLVVDAMIGQDAVKTSRAFNDRLAVTGVILTKLDGDARGGAALSIKEVTGAPILFAGMGEGTDKLEPFRADGMASRILGMGDVVGLMQNFEEVIDQKKAEEDAARLMSGDFTLEDFLEQVRMIQKMGSLKDLVDKLPLGGMFPGGMPADVNLDDRELVRIEAMIQSMTKFEKRDVYSLVREPKRVERVAKGSGSKPEAVSELVQKFLFMKQMMGGLGQNLGMMGKIPGMKQMAMAKNLKKMMGGAGGMPGMGGGAEAPSMTKMKTLSPAERNAKKNQRKRERDARKKGRK
ncbi:MAG TPA: signal recognition particle protein [Byssovorax sp.]